ncbi:cysteine desulfurase NifS [Desulfonatronovibrio hydrogenovorans]|uniref:cysteine desulfurase NifS n=1 Tax=Desulfonatronovibrio hydrogenovorans TaxID=53245 RepID=UPI00048B21E7|nr:cysteine desulfurase NifS [Desulfonatronovibrio hydrogenovorans]
MKTIYLDNNATTRTAPEVIQEMQPFFGEYYGNPSSMHSFGGYVQQKIALARERVGAGLGCLPEEVVFTSGGTEADNAAIFSAVQAQPDKKHLVTTRVEHPAVLSTMKYLEGKGYRITYLGVDQEGRLDMDEYIDSLQPETALVSVMYANNETGVIFPVPEMAAAARDRGILFHTDAVQAMGKISMSLNDLPVDYLVLSGHKIHGPKGVGALYVRKKSPFRPYIMGGHQERGRRAGTENTTGIIGLGKAMELAMTHLESGNKKMADLRDRLEQELLKSVPRSRVNGENVNRLPNTLNISFSYVEGEAILLLLDQDGICASSGSACTSGSLEPSHVLRAMGVPFTHVHGSIRFSLSRYTTDQEIDLVLDRLPRIIQRLRDMSPFSAGNEPVLPNKK